VGVLVLGIGAASAEPAPAGQAAAAPAQQGLRQPDVIYVPTRQTVVDAMLKVANVKAGDVLYDLGCGDGRIPVTAAKLGARAVCIDIDPRRIAEANENVKKNNVGDRVRVLNQDLFTTDISEATVVVVSAAVAQPQAAADAVEDGYRGTRMSAISTWAIEARADANVDEPRCTAGRLRRTWRKGGGRVNSDLKLS
jgi:SAM-dependent methyltransferase